jgi:hypothetical protein
MVIDDDADRPVQRAHLFMLRLWLLDLGCLQQLFYCL